MASGHLILYFRSKLLRWHENENKRTLPWKGEKDPYRIWLSEIILQQTRAEQGLPYYQKFIETYPNVFALAQATTDEVLKLWQGLGYYSRARNLHATAIKVANECKGIFPKSFAELKKLKGIGNYTAAAITSFAYGEPVAVVDGNVSRVLSRFFGIEHEINSSEGRKLVDDLAQRLVCKKQPGVFNQAVMDLGATICTPRTPSCTACPLKLRCKALELGKVHLLPVKQQRVVKKKRIFIYFIMVCNGKTFIRQRRKNDIWKELFEPPAIEITGQTNYNIQTIAEDYFKESFSEPPECTTYRQQLTHQSLEIHFVTLPYRESLFKKFEGENMRVNISELSKFAFPKTISLHFKKIGLL